MLDLFILASACIVVGLCCYTLGYADALNDNSDYIDELERKFRSNHKEGEA